MWTKVIAGVLCTAAAASSVPNCPVLPVISAAEKKRQGTLAGNWVNELGSKMVLELPNAKGEFSGTYLTSVSASQKPIVKSPLIGIQHAPLREGQVTFGFTVNWAFSDSTAVFVGQRFVDEKGKETLETMWLLREEMDSAGDNWKATRVGTNIFKREP
ncbi:avidin-like [Candoia aspera]|uniref:avidin-like n=1 Tax=Candoia aspera TaxID=51853 RepID=UPI002FD8257E